VHVHGTRPRTRAVNTAVSIGSTRPFTGRVLYTGRKHDRLQGTRPCTRPCSGHERTMHGRVHGTYTAVHTVHSPCTAMYTVRTRSGTVNTVVFTAPVHGIVRTVYTAVHGVYGSCTPACKGRVHGESTAMYRVHLHGRVLCTRPCLRPVYMAAHGRVQTVYTAVHGPRTWSVRDPITAVYAARTRPCTPVHCRVPRTRPSLRPVCTALYVPSTEFMQCQSMRQILPNINHPQYS